MAELLEELVEINVEHYKEYHAQVQQKINLVVSNSERLGEEKAVESLESLRKIAGNYTSTSLAYSIANAYFRIKGIEGKDILSIGSRLKDRISDYMNVERIEHIMSIAAGRRANNMLSPQERSSIGAKIRKHVSEETLKALQSENKQDHDYDVKRAYFMSVCFSKGIHFHSTDKLFELLETMGNEKGDVQHKPEIKAEREELQKRAKPVFSKNEEGQYELFDEHTDLETKAASDELHADKADEAAGNIAEKYGRQLTLFDMIRGGRHVYLAGLGKFRQYNSFRKDMIDTLHFLQETDADALTQTYKEIFGYSDKENARIKRHIRKAVQEGFIVKTEGGRLKLGSLVITHIHPKTQNYFAERGYERHPSTMLSNDSEVQGMIAIYMPDIIYNVRHGKARSVSKATLPP